MIIKIRKKSIFNILISTFVFFVAWLIGDFYNVNIITLLIYVVSLFLLYKNDREFFLKNIYIIIINTLFVLGVFFCEINGIFLNEISKRTDYVNCFNLALFSCHICLLFILIFNNIVLKKEDNEETKSNLKSNGLIKFICLIIILVQIVAIVNILIKLKGSIFKIDRFIINKQYLNAFTLKLKNNIILALPFFCLLKGKRKNLYVFLYILLYCIMMFLTGEKYGPYIKLFYLIAIFFPKFFEHLKKKTYIIIFFACLIVATVFLQYKFLYGYTYNNLITYLESRLCQQGQVWWSIYEQKENKSIEISDFSYEIKSSYNSKLSTSLPYAGQWKMMYYAANGSNFVKSRIKNLIPFTSTTLASVYYYFGIIGIFIIYPLFGILYSVIINGVFNNYKKNIITSILAIKLFVMFDYLYTASDLSSLISVKSIIFIIVFLLSVICIKKRRNMIEKS